jgi:hypothetical protein
MHTFPEYTKYSPGRRALVITPSRSGCFHRFFDTSPFSPSGRYVALVQAPFEDRVNLPGEKAGIVVVDLETGEETEVAQTAGWEFQMGANLQWGVDDETLLYNDVDTGDWSSHGVRLQWRTGERTTFARGIYHASPDGRSVAVTNPAAMRRTQKGYGVVIPDELVPVNQGLPDDDGLFVTDLESGKTELVASIRRIVMDAVPKEERADYEAMQNYAFHCKWNPQGDRLMVTLRRKLADHPEPFGVRDHFQMWFDIFTCRPDGSDLHRSVPWTEWKKGGHHTTFTPDGRHLSMNVALHGRGTGMVLMQVKLDGTDYRPITEAVPGSGHPTVHPDGRHILTDTYVNERPDLRPSTVDDAYNPIRWIDVEAGSEEQILWIPTATPHQATDSVLRVDPHPAWSRDWKMAMVNAWMDGTRRPVVIVME